MRRSPFDPYRPTNIVLTLVSMFVIITYMANLQEKAILKVSETSEFLKKEISSIKHGPSADMITFEERLDLFLKYARYEGENKHQGERIQAQIDQVKFAIRDLREMSSSNFNGLSCEQVGSGLSWRTKSDIGIINAYFDK